MSSRSEPSSVHRFAGFRAALAEGMVRGCCAAVGLFLAANVLAGWIRPGLNGNEWLLDAAGLGVFGDVLLLACGVALGWYALQPAAPKWRRAMTAVSIGLLMVIAAANIIGYYGLAARGRIVAGSPAPMSLGVLVLLLLMLAGVLKWRPAAEGGSVGGAALAVGVLTGLAGVFPAAQMVFFGTTSYARPADAIVVFGARVYADGRPSDALSDRVLHACDLYRSGIAPVVIMSGGPGDGAAHECEAMRDLAIANGVAPGSILLDYGGVNTEATVTNAATIMRERGLGSAVAVSHFYHLPRIRLQAERTGVEMYTSPSPQRDGPLVRLPWFMARESAAFWVYWARGWTS